MKTLGILAASALCAACTSAPVSQKEETQDAGVFSLEIEDKGERCFEMRSRPDQAATTVCPFVDISPVIEGKQ